MLENIGGAIAEPGWMLTLGIGCAVFVGVVSILFEVLEIIFILTPTERDDIWLNKVRAKWSKVKPFLEWFHIKTPLVKLLAKALTGVQTVKAAVLDWKKRRASPK